MAIRKFLKYFLLVLVFASFILGSTAQVQSVVALPSSPVDETKVPHYFGPYPNWANSPFTLADVAVSISGDGTGATATASVGANGAVTGITITNPGSGYTAATISITGAGSGASANAVVTTSGSVTTITVDTPGAGYTTPVVTVSGGGGTGTIIQVGNPLVERAGASDGATYVFVVVPTPLPTGLLQSFLTLNQATGGGSAGYSFNAYILRPTGIPNEYLVVFDSGLNTVPALTIPGVSEIATFPVADIPVQALDVLAFYGQGIPLDIVTGGADILSWPALAAPLVGNTITLGGAGFPIYPQARTYSFSSKVLVPSGPLTDATATAFGGVDSLTLDNPGFGYHMPTVAFDLPDDPTGTQPTAHVLCDFPNCSNPNPDGTPGEVTIIDIVLDTPGSGYSSAPGVAILDGTQFDPVRPGGTGALATATLSIQSVTVDTFGSGYTSAPDVTISDQTGSGAGATATATVDVGTVTGITNLVGGSGYITAGGIKKFQDGLPVLCIPSANFSECTATDNNLGQHIPIAIADTTTFSAANGFADADYYVIAVVQHRERMSSSLPATGSLMREYVQLETPANASFSKGILLNNDLVDGTSIPALMPDGTQAVAVDDPHYLGPVIVALRDKAVRIVFYNLLPTGVEGDLFLPTDTTVMGSGMTPGAPDPLDEGTVMDYVRNSMCTEKYNDPTMRDMCFTENRATLHLHGGVTPWISDGTPHQWITPANESTPWPQGVSVEEVPDMAGVAGVPDCTSATDGCQTFYYTNQQSARLMFYHDHAWGITRLNVYAGEAAGYVITDSTEQALIAPGGALYGLGVGIPLVIQDRTFVPDAAQLAAQDPTWDSTRWGGYGNLWYHHVYMPAQNPGDPSGMSGYGRWMYGPWFWPPATPLHGPIANPYYNMDPATGFTTPLAVACNLDDPTTWQYQTDPFCEPQFIPGTPNISVGMEQFNDTPIVNGTAYPTTTVDPKSYRFRILNAANDRFWNLQWYVADPRTGTLSEVALNPSELAAAQTDPNVVPTPDRTWSPAGPSWIQIGTEGGFLPAPVVIPNQPITWIIDPTRFDVGNVDKHSLLLAPAERADVIVDFSRYAGQTLILYNDAPAAFPARVATYDYYLGAPDMSPVGAPTILPGYGPNTRTIMQVNVSATAPAPAFNLSALNTAFRHHANGSGVFESDQHPIIVGQAAYNSAYGTTFASSSWCNAPGSPLTRCDGFARISEQGGDLFGFNTLKAQNTKMQIPLQPKALHDEMNSVAFDEFGRMTANLGLEVVPASPAGQNIVLYPYVNPSTELIDATNLPHGDINVTPISSAADGTQIWKITHNGVDTHPIHFHLYDVQVLNRVTWDNIIIPPEGSEIGWKDTVRISPLEDTIVALRPVIPTVPFELPNSIRELNPMMADGSTVGFNNIDADGNPTDPIVNQLVNFGWEYVYHCHILSHEEMDMMRPVLVALPPNAPDGLAFVISGPSNNRIVTLTWNDNSINETSFVIQRDDGTGYVDLATIPSALDQPNTHRTGLTYVDNTFDRNLVYNYRIVAKNTVGYGGQFMSLAVQSMTTPVLVGDPPAAPTTLTLQLGAGPQVRLTWRDNDTNEAGFKIERSTDGVNFSQIATAPANNGSPNATFIDTTVGGPTNVTYFYRVAAFNLAGTSAYTNIASILVPGVPAAPSNLVAVNGPNNGNLRSVRLTWTDNSNIETGFTIQRATNAAFTTGLNTVTVGANVTTLTQGGLGRFTNYYFRIRANNGAIVFSAWVNATPFPIRTNP